MALRTTLTDFRILILLRGLRLIAEDITVLLGIQYTLSVAQSAIVRKQTENDPEPVVQRQMFVVLIARV
jgi:hypothetical protein